MSPTNKFEELELHVSPDLSNTRLDKVVSTHPKIPSRNRAAQLISLKLVTLNGKVQKASKIAEEGETYKILLPLESDQTLQAYKLDLDILHEDDDIIVLNKPSGIVVHPSHGHDNDTLVNALVNHCKNLSMGFSENRPGIVHRLDKDTSGILVVAKNDESHHHLAQQFKEKTVERMYRALVFGRPKTDFGRIESYLVRHPVNRKKYCSERLEQDDEPKGKWSATNWQFVDTYNDEISYLTCRLETGRTHQIRVHLSEMGHPIIGDNLYSKSSRVKAIKSKSLRNELSQLNRLGLIATTLGFVHPKTKKRMSFKIEWPENLKEILTLLGFK